MRRLPLIAFCTVAACAAAAAPASAALTSVAATSTVCFGTSCTPAATAATAKGTTTVQFKGLTFNRMAAGGIVQTAVATVSLNAGSSTWNDPILVRLTFSQPTGASTVDLTGRVSGTLSAGAGGLDVTFSPATFNVPYSGGFLRVFLPDVIALPTSTTDLPITARIEDRGPLDHLVLTPGTATVDPGEEQAYTAQGFDSSNRSLGDFTAAATFLIADGSCTANRCSSAEPGSHAVTANVGAVIGGAVLTVKAPPAPVVQTETVTQTVQAPAPLIILPGLTRLTATAGKRVTLPYLSTQPGRATLEVLRGRRTIAQVTGTTRFGANKITWNGKRGRKAAPPGNYVLRLVVSTDSEQKEATARLKLTRRR